MGHAPRCSLPTPSPQPASRRPSLALLAAAVALAGCGGTVDFTIDRTLQVDTTVDAGRSSATYDLAAEAGSAWKERSHLDSLSIRGATATVTAVGASNAATSESGTVWLLPDGVTDPADPSAVEVGRWAGEPVVPGHVIALAPSTRLDDLVTSALKGSGRLGVAAAVDGGGARLQVTLRVEIDLRLKWKP
jgi:hypothetical protein